MKPKKANKDKKRIIYIMKAKSIYIIVFLYFRAISLYYAI